MAENRENKKKEYKSFKVGIIAGLIASLCCISPIIIVLFGLGTVSFALSFTQYKIYFLLAAFIFTLLATILYLRQRSKACNINCFSKEGIKREKNFLITVAAIMVAVYFSMTYIISPQISSFLYSSLQKSSEQKAAINNLRLLTLQINGLTCPGCAVGLEYYFGYLDGVVKAKVYYPSGKAEVFYDPAKITKDKIVSIPVYTAYIVNDTSVSLDSIGEIKKLEEIDKVFMITSTNSGYEPSRIEVKKGDIVKLQFMNVDGVNHSLVIDEYEIKLEAPAYGGMNNIPEAVFKVNESGTFRFYDPLYPKLEGLMVVS
jgi:copper chaperone CopZ